jgi:ABC-2 type transport system permease protein
MAANGRPEGWAARARVTMLSIVLTGAALIREREHGTIEHLLVMPVTPAEIMMAKVWSMRLVVQIGHAILFRGAGIDVVWRPFLWIVVIGSVLFALSLARFRNALSQMA